jgi:GNAT superfamily N-acetyltransferase
VSTDFCFRLAVPEDVSDLAAIARNACQLYVPRIGREPAPMVADFKSHVLENEVYVLEERGDLVGYIVTYPRKFDQFVENVAVRSDRQGSGSGYSLMTFAETKARENCLKKLVLYTNVKMIENLAFYSRLGYVETERVLEDGFERVYFEKRLLT